jgi:hypothetical protein
MSDEPRKGYNYPYVFEIKPPVVEKTLVGCRRCNETWSEDYAHHGNFRINGPMMIYDYCDNCKKKDEPVK